MGADIKKALTTAGDFKIDDPSGAGYLPKPLADEIVRYISEINYCRQLFRTIIMAKKTLDIPVLSSGRTTPGKGVYFVPSQVDISGKTDQVGPRLHAIRLEAKKLMAYANVDNDDIEDAAVDVVDLLLESFGEAFAEAEELAMMDGWITGAAPFAADDPRSAFDGLALLGSYHPQTGTITESDLEFKGIEETVSKAIKMLGKYGRSRKNLVFFIDSTIAEYCRRSRRLVNITNLAGARTGDAAMVEPGQADSIYGISTYESSYLDAGLIGAGLPGAKGVGVLLPKDEALIGDRRKIKIVKKELEEHDKIRFVISERIDFTVRHKAYNKGMAGDPEAVVLVQFN